MPTVLKDGPYRIFFFASDRAEPAHVHVERDDAVAKIWLDPPRVAKARGFSDVEMRRILTLVSAHEARFLEVWRDCFS